MKNLDAKMSIRLNMSDYAGVIDKLHHGQTTLLMRTIVASLADIIASGKTQKLRDFMYKDKNLTLPKRKE